MDILSTSIHAKSDRTLFNMSNRDYLRFLNCVSQASKIWLRFHEASQPPFIQLLKVRLVRVQEYGFVNKGNSSVFHH